MRLKTSATLIALSLLSISCGGSGGAAAQSGFSVASIRGGYASIFLGTFPTGTEVSPIVGTGIFVADGSGNLTGHETFTVVTTPCGHYQGTYAVHPDGSGTDSITFTTTTPGCASGKYTQALAIAQSGQLVLLSNTNGDQISEQWHLQK